MASPNARRKTRFSTLIRTDPKQRDWLEANKDTRTLAGFLDKIINDYRRAKERE